MKNKMKMPNKYCSKCDHFNELYLWQLLPVTRLYRQRMMLHFWLYLQWLVQYLQRFLIKKSNYSIFHNVTYGCEFIFFVTYVPLALPAACTPLSTADAATFFAVSTVLATVSMNKIIIFNEKVYI